MNIPPDGPGLQIRRLAVADVETYRAIRLSALRTEPDAFGATYAVEAGRPAAVHAERLAGSAVFGAFAGAQIVGMAAFRRHDGPREAHKGFLWGVYVEPGSRGRGAGRALLEAVLDAARSQVEQVTLTVVAGNAAAIALYERAGFRRYGTEERALKSEAGTIDEALMVRFFGAPPPGEAEG